MTIQPEYKTIANGSIDYAHYDRRARALRSHNAWSSIGAFGKALMAIATTFNSGGSNAAKPVSQALNRKPMRTPQMRRTNMRTAREICETAAR